MISPSSENLSAYSLLSTIKYETKNVMKKIITMYCMAMIFLAKNQTKNDIVIAFLIAVNSLPTKNGFIYLASTILLINWL